MANKTDIFNLALGRVGAAAIMSYDETPAKGAAACRNAFELTVREVSRAADWNCLRKRETLGQLVDTPAFEWGYQYQLPADFIRLVGLNGVEYHGQPQDDWEIEGRYLLTDAEQADVKYTAYFEDCTIWDAMFANAVVVLLASKISIPMRQDEGLAQTLLMEYQRLALPQARKTDANERRVERFNPVTESRFVNSRYYNSAQY